MKHDPHAESVVPEGTGEPPIDLATEALETIPKIMRALRGMMRAQAGTSLSLLEFRALGFIERKSKSNEQITLTDLANHLGIAIPGASRLVQVLCDQHLVERREHPQDRRKVLLTILPKGADLRIAARQRTQEWLQARLQALTPEQLEALTIALPALKTLFDDQREQHDQRTPPSSASQC